MGGLFGVASKQDCVNDLFFGIDYHSHLGTRRGGMAVCENGHFNRAIHNIENAPFRTKFEDDVQAMTGEMGIGSISDTDPQPLLVRSHFGIFALATVGRMNNADAVIKKALQDRRGHFMEMSSGKTNATELVASIISARDNLIEGLQAAQDIVDGSMTMLAMTADGLFAARDRMGRTSLTIGQREDGYAVSTENFAYRNLGYLDVHELGPKEIVQITPDGYQTVSQPGKKMKICAFLWTYYGYPTSSYEGQNVEQIRYNCGEALARQDGPMDVDYVSGVPDSGVGHALGYSHASGRPYKRPLIKYTPTWPRSFMPPKQDMRQMIANMKLISVPNLIDGQRMLLIDDSIVRGTQTKKMADYLYKDGAKEVHIRAACPPIMFGCKYLNFSESTSEYDLIARRIVREMEGDKDQDRLMDYVDGRSDKHHAMVGRICELSNFSSLGYLDLKDMLKAIGIDPCSVCTYCWDGKED